MSEVKTSMPVANGRVVRIAARRSRVIEFKVDGELVPAWTGDMLLVAVLSQRGALRIHEFDGEPRAGFCLMGACQDCWVWLEDGTRLRACTTPVEPGLAVLTRPPTNGFFHG
jgi:hypothetical protein